MGEASVFHEPGEAAMIYDPASLRMIEGIP
jgi:hypothetical protein